MPAGDRLALEREKANKLVDHCIEIERIHANNRHLIFSNADRAGGGGRLPLRSSQQGPLRDWVPTFTGMSGGTLAGPLRRVRSKQHALRLVASGVTAVHLANPTASLVDQNAGGVENDAGVVSELLHVNG